MLVQVKSDHFAENYFDIADSISLLLNQIEGLDFSNPASNPAPSFYTPTTSVEQATRTVIRHWAILTGRDVKQRKAA